MTRRHATGLPIAVLASLVVSSPAAADCAATLSLGGVGGAVAARVKPYVVCLNAAYGTPQELRSACSMARELAAQPRDKAIDKNKLDRTLRWLDEMIVERAACETRLSVEA